jgi:hypothetical protein
MRIYWDSETNAHIKGIFNIIRHFWCVLNSAERLLNRLTLPSVCIHIIAREQLNGFS